MLPGIYDLELYRGDTAHYNFVLWQDGSKTIPYDLTGNSASAQVRDRADSGRVVVQLYCTIALPNTVNVSLLAGDSAALPASCRGVWDLQLTTAALEVHTVVAGNVQITSDVTRFPVAHIPPTPSGYCCVHVGDTPPPGVPGALWWDSVGGNLYLYFQDVDTGQWVPATNAGMGVAGASGVIPTNTIVPVDGGTATLADGRAVYIDNAATLASYTLLLPTVLPDTVMEIGFRNPITSLSILTAGGGAIDGAPTNAFGPGAAIQMKYLSAGWTYWK